MDITIGHTLKTLAALLKPKQGLSPLQRQQHRQQQRWDKMMDSIGSVVRKKGKTLSVDWAVAEDQPVGRTLERWQQQSVALDVHLHHDTALTDLQTRQRLQQINPSVRRIKQQALAPGQSPVSIEQHFAGDGLGRKQREAQAKAPRTLKLDDVKTLPPKQLFNLKQTVQLSSLAEFKSLRQTVKAAAQQQKTQTQPKPSAPAKPLTLDVFKQGKPVAIQGLSEFSQLRKLAKTHRQQTQKANQSSTQNARLTL